MLATGPAGAAGVGKVPILEEARGGQAATLTLVHFPGLLVTCESQSWARGGK